MTNSPIDQVAPLLAHLSEDICYVGASVLPFYVDAATRADLRATVDVDAVVAVSSYYHYVRVVGALNGLGFVQQAGDGIQHFRRGELVLDLVPCPPAIVGRADAWIQEGMAAKETVCLAADLEIRVFPAAWWLVAKISAFMDRGAASFFESKDLEDILALVDGRPGIVQEVANLPDEPRRFIQDRLAEMLERDDVNDIVAGLMPRSGGRGRERILIGRIHSMTAR